MYAEVLNSRRPAVWSGCMYLRVIGYVCQGTCQAASGRTKMSACLFSFFFFRLCFSLTKEQMASRICRKYYYLGTGIGVSIGCLLGRLAISLSLFPLLSIRETLLLLLLGFLVLVVVVIFFFSPDSCLKERGFCQVDCCEERQTGGSSVCRRQVWETGR